MNDEVWMMIFLFYCGLVRIPFRLAVRLLHASQWRSNGLCAGTNVVGDAVRYNTNNRQFYWIMEVWIMNISAKCGVTKVLNVLNFEWWMMNYEEWMLIFLFCVWIGEDTNHGQIFPFFSFIIHTSYFILSRCIGPSYFEITSFQ